MLIGAWAFSIWAFRDLGDEREACELLKCLNAASALQYAQSKEVMVIETGASWERIT